MKDFFKTALATVAGLIIFSFISLFLLISLISSVASLSESTPVVPQSAILTIDLSKVIISEQTQERDLLSMLQGNEADIRTTGIYNMTKAIKTAAIDPCISMIYLKPDVVMGGMAQIEELRSALEDFRASGKAIVSYMESPSNAGMYLASVSDKIYMTSYDGGISMFTGASSQMIFIKDLLETLGINVQLIRHGKYKSAGEMFINTSPSKENLQQNQALVESIWKNWIKAIADARDINPEALDAMVDNLELNFPSDFLAKGLVDELVTKDELRTKLSYLSYQTSYDNLSTISISDYAVARENLVMPAGASKIAVVFVEGEMIDGDGYDQVAGDRFASILASIRKDENVKATVLRVNSPGGSVLAAEKILSEIRLLQERMPVVASFGDYAASGGYWISAGCNKIFSNANTLTGSIGVFSMIPDFSKTLKNKLHVNVVSVNSNQHADMYTMMRPMNNAEVKVMQNSVEQIYGKFTGLVAEGRGLSMEQVEDIAQGRVWSGSDALNVGLVDEIGTLEDAINWTIASISNHTDVADISISTFPQPLTDWEILLTQLEGSGNNILSDTPFKNIGEAFHNWTSAETGKVYARIPFEYVIK